MEYINLTITQLAEADCRRSSLEDRGTWLTLLAYCVQQENSGRITGAKGWSDWDCSQVLGIPSAKIEGDHLLWRYEGGDLIVKFYPLDKQREVKAKRAAGRRGGINSGQARLHPSSSSDDSSASSTASTEGEGNEKGKEGEGKDGQRPDSLAQVVAYAKSISISEIEANKFFDHFEANGWRQGGRTSLRSWQAALRNWGRRAGEYAAQKSSSGGGAAAFNAETPNAHTGGMEVFEAAPSGEPAAASTGGAL